MASQSWQVQQPYGAPTPGAAVQRGAGGYGYAPESELDARRMGSGRIPQAEYPDGYLGTINARAEDRVLQTLKGELTNRSYQRGVHKGEKIDPGDYVWPADLTPDRGIQMQAQGIRNAPIGTTTEQLLYGNRLPDNAQHLVDRVPTEVNPERRRQLGSLLPDWR